MGYDGLVTSQNMRKLKVRLTKVLKCEQPEASLKNFSSHMCSDYLRFWNTKYIYAQRMFYLRLHQIEEQ